MNAPLLSNQSFNSLQISQYKFIKLANIGWLLLQFKYIATEVFHNV